MSYCSCVQGISVVEQEQLDNMMIEMDGTENKCESDRWSDGRTSNALKYVLAESKHLFELKLRFPTQNI